MYFDLSLLLVRLITRISQSAEIIQLSSLVLLLSSHTASRVMMFRLTISGLRDVGMMDIFAVCALLFDLLFHRYILVMVLYSSFCACVNLVCCD